MANAAVDKLKDLGLRHGEKVVVGLTAGLFVAFAVLAVLKPTVDIKPEELKTTAERADSNLGKQQDPTDILARLEEQGLKNPDFEKMVKNQKAHALKADDFRVKHEWVSPEPGAGLIRDQPELIAPTELTAFPGRGGILMFALNEKGERIPDTGPDAAKAPKRGRGSRGMGMPGMAGMAGMPGFMGGPPNETPEAAKKREAIEAEKKKRLFVGKGDSPKDKDDKEKDSTKSEESAAGPQETYKEETKGKRWVVITGVLDNEQLKKNYLQALKVESIAYPNYKRLDVQRQVRQEDGTWTDWAAIDQDKNFEVLDNLPEVDEEYVPETMRPEALNDPLPFLRAGYWTGVHIARLVPADVRDPSKAAAKDGMGMMGMPGMGMPGMGMPGMGGGASRMGYAGMMKGSGGYGTSGGMRAGGPGGPGGMMGMMGGMAGMAGMAGGSLDAEETNFTKIEEKTIQVRSLDFTVDRNTAYRFRVRVVVVNPNKDHTDVNPGVDVESKELLGPWSEPTNEVEVPDDVAAYAQAPGQADRRRDQVAFQVVKWDPATGHTVMKTDEAGPGEIIGDVGSVQIPSSEGGGPKTGNLDFNSRAVVLDTTGGRERLPDIGVDRNQFEVPALAMVVQPDGSVVLRSQAVDKGDDVRQDMEANYRQALEDSGKKRESGMSRAQGMMGYGGSYGTSGGRGRGSR